MLAGQPATYIYFNIKDIDINLGGHLPADFDGLNPPPVGAPGLFMELDHGIPADGDAYLMRIWEFHADFANPANSTFGSTAGGDWGHANYKLAVDPFNYLTGYVVPQPDTGRMLDAIGDRLMYRLAYRNFGDRQVLVGSQTVDAGSGRAGIRWFEVQDSGTGWSIHQQGTYAPGDGAYRWMGSIAADALGNLALGFSISSSSMYPSINYTGRLANDPLGAMAQGEAVLVSGSGSQTFPTRALGGLLLDVRGPARRLHLLVHQRVLLGHQRRGLANPHRRLPLLRLRFTRHRHALWHSHPRQQRRAPGRRHGHRGDFVDGHRRGREIRLRPAAGQL